MLRGQAALARGVTLDARPSSSAILQLSRAVAHTSLSALAAAGLRSVLSSLSNYASGMGRRGASSVSALGDEGMEAAAAEPAAKPARLKPGRKPAAPLATPQTEAAAAAAAADDEAVALVAQTVPLTPSSRSKKRPRQSEASLYVQTNQRQLLPKALAIAEHLQKLYPSPPIPLDHASDFQLLCAVILSAQTTDKKVNEVTPELFRLAPDAAAMAALEVPAIAACIRQLGLAPTKAKNLRAMSAALVLNHGGAVPASFEELEALPGVGHKIASVVMAQAHGLDAFPVDTHIHRLAQRWGLTGGKSVEQTEADLKLLFPPASWRDVHLQIIYFGREKCPARSHSPAECPICSWAAVSPYDKPGNSPLKAGGRRSPAKPEAKKRAAAGTASPPKRSKKTTEATG